MFGWKLETKIASQFRRLTGTKEGKIKTRTLSEMSNGKTKIVPLIHTLYENIVRCYNIWCDVRSKVRAGKKRWREHEEDNYDRDDVNGDIFTVRTRLVVRIHWKTT